MQIKAGTTSVSIDVLLVDNAGLELLGKTYSDLNTAFGSVIFSLGNNTANNTSTNYASLAALTTAWTSGGFKERGQGVYRFDCPDAMFATAGTKPTLIGGVAGYHIFMRYELEVVAFDPQDAVRMGMGAFDSSGNLNGNVGGSVNGGVFGGVSGDISGNLNGNVNGNVNGSVNSGVSGGVSGDISGNVTGNVNGSVQGGVFGGVSGTLNGNVTGNVNGNVNGSVGSVASADDANLVAVNGTTFTGVLAPTNLKAINGTTFSGVVVPASGNWSTYAGADTAGTTALLARLPYTITFDGTHTYPLVNTNATAVPAGMALDSTVAKDATVSKPGTPQTITAPATMATVANQTAISAALAGLITTVGTAGAGLTGIPGLTDPWTVQLPGAYATGRAGKILAAAGSAGDPWSTLLPGTYSAGQAGYIIGRTGFTIIASSPVTPAGQINLESGNDYYAADGRAVSFTFNGDNLTGATAQIITDLFTITGSITSPATNPIVSFDIPRASLPVTSVGSRPFSLWVTLSNGHEFERLTGLMNVAK